MDFSIRPVEDILEDIEKAADYFDGRAFESCFLQDGDSFIMKTADLLMVLGSIKSHFPTLKRVTSYGRAATMIRKDPSEMKEIQAAGLNRLYCGMESGDDDVLELVSKGTKAEDIVRAGCMAKDAGMEISEFVIMGLGGRELWQQHAKNTANALNEIDPDYIRVRTIGVKVGGDLEQKRNAGEYVLQIEQEIIEEQKVLLAGLDKVNSYYSNDHSVNLLIEAEGQLPEDREKLLRLMDAFLDMPEEEQDNFIFGRRLGVYYHMHDMRHSNRYEHVAQQLEFAKERYPGKLQEIFHSMRERVV